jgi:GntR family transcriptional regulator
MININSPVPFYYQLVQILREDIETGKIKSGETIPTESEFMNR